MRSVSAPYGLRLTQPESHLRQRPKDARDPRRNNRRLHLCIVCGNYKQPVEFYACCLHDNPRCCRDCMLTRPAEPFGEHLMEERCTQDALLIVTASAP